MSNNLLPVADFRDQILEAVAANPAVIITAETGAGKSTQVPQYLLDAGYDIVVTQPRRLAARTVAQRVAEEYDTPFGEVVGFRTAYERQDSPRTRCLFATDGLGLARELMSAGKHNLLVIDEVHEWNLNIEVLVAWAKHQIEIGVNFKVVLMSATLEADKLAHYFGGAPVISVPGRLFPVSVEQPSHSVKDDVTKLLQQGRNVLVFQPGKGEISDLISELRLGDLNAEILPLHGELNADDQKKCFQVYSRPKCVVSTNVAQTSVTIPDIDAVVDTGMERRTELVNGVEGLYLKPISWADSDQRKGRAGRTKPGIYIDWCKTDSRERPAFPRAEILRTRLDQTVLRLAEAGIDMEVLRFFHQPDLAEIHEAKRALRSLGCMDDAGKVTRIGRLVAKLPVSVQYARMIVEADRLGVVDDIITAAAILEQGEINARVCSECRSYDHRSCTCWQRQVTSHGESDILAQMKLFELARDMNRDQMMAVGVFAKAFYQAKEKRKHIADALRGKVRFGSTGHREDILKAICAGMVDHLYHRTYGAYINGDAVERQLNRGSFAAGATWIVGLPWDLEIKARYGGTNVLNLVRMASKVSPVWLAEVAPQMVERKTGLLPHFDPMQDSVVSTTEMWFNGQLIESQEILDPTHPEAARILSNERNNELWKSWMRGELDPPPYIPVPNIEASEIPEIVKVEYGRDIQNGEPLLAYGVIAPAQNWLFGNNRFALQWVRDPDAAEKLRHASLDLVERRRTELDQARHDERSREQEREQLLPQALELRDKINALLREHGELLEDDLFSQLDRRDVEDDQLPRATWMLDDWIGDARRYLKRAQEWIDDVKSQPNEVGADQLAALLGRFGDQR